MNDYTNKKPSELSFLDKIDFLFWWVKLFYPKFRGLKSYYLFFFFFPQRILGINRFVSWPTHFTSRILYGSRIKAGINTAPGLSNGCYIQGRNGIVFGNNVRIGPGVGIVSANHDPDNYDDWLPSIPIRIGDNVWIGMNSVIMPGVQIGENCVIGSNSVVTSDIPPNSIAMGTPCRVVKAKSPYRGKNWS